MRQDHTTLDGHDLPEAVQSHLTATRGGGGQIQQQRTQHLIQNTGACREGGGGATQGQSHGRRQGSLGSRGGAQFLTHCRVETVKGEGSCCTNVILLIAQRTLHCRQNGVHVEEDIVT